MASYVFSFSAASDNLSTFQEIPLDPSQGNYAQANTGHQAIDISATASATGTAHTFTLAWADCDQNKANAVLGVTKVDAVTITPGARRTDITGAASGGYVCSVSVASSSSSLAKVIGIGDVIDLRTSPVALPKRRLFIGLTTLGGGGGTVTVIVTPTKII